MPFRHLAGHRVLLDLVARAAARGSLPPSLIFAGPDGVGKRLAAVSLAQLFNCTNVVGEVHGEPAEPAPDACGECNACRRIARGVHADVLVIEPGDTGSIKVDQVRAAIDRTAYRPFEGRRRVVIVDNADAMEAPPQNALLKTLEEPPAASTFVLVTSRQHIARALQVFRKAGMDPVPSTPDVYVARGDRFEMFLPSRIALYASERLMYDLLGWVYYKARGWL